MKNRKEKQKKPHILAAARTALRKKKAVATVYILLRLSVLLIMVAQFFRGNFENVFLCLLTLVLFLMPTLMEKSFQIQLPNALEIIILLFIYSAEILGEIRAFYTIHLGWDTMLHTINGFLCAAIGFSLVDLFNRNEKFSLSLSPVFMAIVAFCFSMTIGVLWEFFECTVDQLLLFDMQKDTVIHTISSVNLDPTGLNHTVVISDILDTILVTSQGEIPLGVGGYLDVGVLDTMKDLFVNFIGAVVFSFIGYFYVKNRGKGRFARGFIPQVVGKEQSDPEGTEE